MAVAEARAAWQRTANRCFVQEDAKRAPKLACCPSSDASTKQVYPGPGSAADGQDYSVPHFVPLNRNTSYNNVPPDSRWWLQLQPTYGYQRGLTNEHLNPHVEEMETFKAGLRSLKAIPSGGQLENEDDVAFVIENSKSKPFLDAHSIICANCIKKDLGVEKQERKAAYTTNFQESLKVKDGEESYELIEMDPVGCTVFKQSNELCFESRFPWIRDVKSEPWWRTADRDELASCVAQRSLEFLDNCDLPQPRNTHIKRGPHSHNRCIDHDGILTSSVDRKSQSAGHSNPTVDTSDNGTSEVYVEVIAQLKGTQNLV